MQQGFFFMLLLLVVGACEPPPRDEMVLLSRDSIAPQIERFVTDWNRTHTPKIRTTLVPQREFMTKFGSSLAAGDPPDLVIIDLVYAPTFSSSDQFLDITNLAKSLPFRDNLIPSHVRLGGWQDRVYALPFAAEGSFLLINRDLFRQAGLDPDKPPRTWREMEDYARKIRAIDESVYGYYFSGACPGCLVFTFAPMIWASGGDIADATYSASSIDSPTVRAALEFYHRLWAGNQIPPGARVDGGENFENAFLSGKVGMMGSGAFVFERFRGPFRHMDVGVSLLPGRDGGTASFAGGDLIAIPKEARYPDDASQFIRWMLEEEQQVRHNVAHQLMPVRLDLSDRDAYASPMMQTAIAALAMGETPTQPNITI